MERWLSDDLFIFIKLGRAERMEWCSASEKLHVCLSRGAAPSLLFTSFYFKMEKWALIGSGTLGINYLFDFNFSINVYRYYIGFELPLWDSNTTWQLTICLHATGFYNKCKSTSAIRSYLHENTLSHLAPKLIVIFLLNETIVKWLLVNLCE